MHLLHIGPNQPSDSSLNDKARERSKTRVLKYRCNLRPPRKTLFIAVTDVEALPELELTREQVLEQKLKQLRAAYKLDAELTEGW
jgi:hypothetical protein